MIARENDREKYIYDPCGIYKGHAIVKAAIANPEQKSVAKYCTLTYHGRIRTHVTTPQHIFILITLKKKHLNYLPNT